jgi:hypothetical protein
MKIPSKSSKYFSSSNYFALSAWLDLAKCTDHCRISYSIQKPLKKMKQQYLAGNETLIVLKDSSPARYCSFIVKSSSFSMVS